MNVGDDDGMMNAGQEDDTEMQSAQSSPIFTRRNSGAQSEPVTNDGDGANDTSPLARNAVCYVGACFFVLFSGHAPFRSLLPALRPQTGPLLVALNFFAYAIGALVHPRLLTRQRRLCFALGALAHAQWIAVLQLPYKDDTGALYISSTAISSIVNGFGAGLLWSTQGGWIHACCALDSPRRAGQYTGIFLSFYGASGFIGNVAAAIALYFLSYTAINNVVWALFIIAALGATMLAVSPARFIYPPRPVNGEDATKNNDGPGGGADGEPSLAVVSAGSSKRFHATSMADANTGTIAERRKIIKALFCETIFTRSIPAICALSATSAFAWVVVPTLCSAVFNGQPGTVLGAHVVPSLFAAYAFANAVGAPASSLLFRRFSIPVVFAAISLLQTLPAMIYFLFFHTLVDGTGYTVYVLGFMTFVFGIIVGTYNNCLYALYASTITPQAAARTSLPAHTWPHLSGEAYCLHGFFYCVFFTIFSTMAAFVQMQITAALVAIVTVFATVSFLSLRGRVV